MAVQKSRCTHRRRNMRRSHDKVSKYLLSVDKTSKEKHIRHNITKNGYYKGKQIIDIKK
jgi:large subunit ribosomal protein L32